MTMVEQILDHFERQFKTLDTLYDRVSDEAWMYADQRVKGAWQWMAHLLETIEFYLGDKNDGFPWGHRFENTVPITDVRNTGESLPQPDDGNGPTVRVAGRIMLLRSAGNLVFLDLTDRTSRIQIMLGKKQVGADLWPIVKCLDLGDLIGIDGRLGY